MSDLEISIAKIAPVDFDLETICKSIRSEQPPLPQVVTNVMKGLKKSTIPGIQKKEIAVLIVRDLLLEISNVLENDTITILLGEMVPSMIDALFEVGKKHFKGKKCFGCIPCK